MAAKSNALNLGFNYVKNSPKESSFPEQKTFEE
jgi:hypothetical protein